VTSAEDLAGAAWDRIGEVAGERRHANPLSAELSVGVRDLALYDALLGDSEVRGRSRKRIVTTERRTFLSGSDQVGWRQARTIPAITATHEIQPKTSPIL